MATILGQVTVDEVDILLVDDDPGDAAGTPAPFSSMAIERSGGSTVARTWQKIGPLDTDWIQYVMGEPTIGLPGSGIFPLVVWHENVTTNDWFRLWHNHTDKTDKRPYFSPFNFNIIGYTVMNKITSIDQDLEIYINGTLIGNRVATIELRNRFQYDMTLTPIEISAGDRVSFFSRDQGKDAEDLMIQLWCVLRDNTYGTGTYNVVE